MDFSRLNTLGLFFLCCIVPAACDQKSEDNRSLSFTVTGKLTNSESGPIFLSSLVDRQFVIIDSASIGADGIFRFKGNVTEPDIYRLSITPDNSMMFVIDGPEIEIQADAGALWRTYEINGSKESDRLQELISITAVHEQTLSEVERRFMASRKGENSDSTLFYRQKYLALQTQYSEHVKEFIRSNPASFVSAYAAFALLNPQEDAPFLDSMLVFLEKRIPDSKYVQLLKGALHAMPSLAVGSLAPDISLPQPDGSAFKLSSLKGRYVLIDFWASWCRPCREENPRVVALYHRYKNKGFEILGVSLDESKSDWVHAIEKDKLPWHQVSDLKGGVSPVAQKYNVEAIPMTVLLDRQGKVIARNLRGSTLEEKLEELFPAE
jgi:peroxiredoxin